MPARTDNRKIGAQRDTLRLLTYWPGPFHRLADAGECARNAVWQWPEPKCRSGFALW